MGFLSRVFSGVARAVTAPIRAAITPFTFAFNELKTIGKAAGALVGGGFPYIHPFKAIGELLGGTISNATRAGVNLLEGANPALAFAEGFARDKGFNPFTSGSGLGLT